MTYLDQFNSAMKCKTGKAAAVWLEKEVRRYWVEHGIKRVQARLVILANLGYMAGYFKPSVSKKVWRLFGAKHPIFGRPEQAAKLSPDNCMRLGMEIAGPMITRLGKEGP